MTLPQDDYLHKLRGVQIRQTAPGGSLQDGVKDEISALQGWRTPGAARTSGRRWSSDGEQVGEYAMLGPRKSDPPRKWVVEQRADVLFVRGSRQSEDLRPAAQRVRW